MIDVAAMIEEMVERRSGAAPIVLRGVVTAVGDEVLVRIAGSRTPVPVTMFSVDVPVEVDDFVVLLRVHRSWMLLARYRSTPGARTVGVTSPEGSYTLQLTDAGRTVTFDSADAVSLVVPRHLLVAFPVKTRVEVVQLGAGSVTIVAGTGVTIESAASLTLADRYTGATLMKIAEDRWVLYGQVA